MVYDFSFNRVKMSRGGSIAVVVVWKKCLYWGDTAGTETSTSQKNILFKDAGAKWFYILTIYILSSEDI